MYLSQFGYLSPTVRNPQSGHIVSEDTLTKAIQEFQSFAGLNVTGESVLNVFRIKRLIIEPSKI